MDPRRVSTGPTVAYRSIAGPRGSALGDYLAGPVHRRAGMPVAVRPLDRVAVEAGIDVGLGGHVGLGGDGGRGNDGAGDLPRSPARVEADVVRARRSGAVAVEVADPRVLDGVAAFLALSARRGRESVGVVRADPSLVTEMQIGAWCETGWRTRALRRCRLGLVTSRLPAVVLDRLPTAAVGLAGDLAFWEGVRQAATGAEWQRFTRSYVVLSYHRITGDRKPDQELLDVLPRNFRRQMRALRLLRFRPLAPADLRAIHLGGGAPPRRSFVVTADDGFEDCTGPLADAKVHAQLFVPVSEVGGVADSAWARAHPSPGWMVDDEPLAGWDRLREIEARGVEIGSHALRHVALTELSPGELHRQLAEARQVLDRHLARPLDAIAYPHGLYDVRVRDAAIATGHTVGYTTQVGRNGAGTDRGCLRRVPVHRGDGLATFLFKVVTGEAPRRGLAAGRGPARTGTLGRVAAKGRSLARLATHPTLESLAETRRGRRLAAALFGMREAAAVAAVDALAEAGIAAWVAGGWGVDALAGRRTRHHGDLDLVVDRVADRHAVAAALAPLGYRFADSGETPGAALSLRWSFTTRRRARIDVCPVDAQASPFGPGAFTTGRIGARVVPCLSAVAQRACRAGYPARPGDGEALALLRTLG